MIIRGYRQLRSGSHHIINIDPFSTGRAFARVLALPLFLVALVLFSAPSFAQNQVCIQCASDGAATAGTAQCANAGGGWTAFSGDLTNNAAPAADNSACRVRAVSGTLINAACEICIQCAFAGNTGSPDTEACVLADGSWSAYSGDRNNNAAPATDGLSCRVSMECPSGCPSTTFGSGDTACTVNARNDGGTSGSCAEDGTCSYTCTNGSWSGVNNCTGAPAPVCGSPDCFVGLGLNGVPCDEGSYVGPTSGTGLVGGGGDCNWQCRNSAGDTVNCTTTSSISTCFIAGTKVTLADGSTKAIEELKAGDEVIGKDGSVNIVQHNQPKTLNDRMLYAFNGGPFFVTAEHPFMTTGGWKSINPDKTVEINTAFNEGDVTGLKVGDTLILENGKTMTIETIESRDRYPTEMPVYNPSLNGDQTYFADGYLVHNK